MILLPLMLQAAANGAWSPHTHQDGNTGATSLSAGTTSRDGSARLTVRCDNNGTDPVVSVQYITRTPLGATDDRPVSVTVDGKPPIDGTWEFPGNGTFVRDSALVTQLTVALATAKTVRVHTTDLNNNPVDATFDGPPNDSAVKQVLATCNYQFGVVPTPKAAPAPTPQN